MGVNKGVAPDDVGATLARFERTLQSAVAALDERYPSGQELDADGLAAIIDLCAWAHAEWIRIHPFANGNGRTARIWANVLLMRYGLPPVMRLRPRPNDGYGGAGAVAILRCTRKLLVTLGVQPANVEEVRSTTRLGDWYADILFTARQHVVLCVSEHARVPVVIPARELKTLPSRLPEALAQNQPQQ